MPNDVINTITIGNTTYDIGGSGHIIEKSDGTDMTQRANLQFLDATVTDDSTNDRTKIENVHMIQSESELDNLPDGLYMLDEDEGTVIDSSDVGYDNTDSGLEATNVQDAIDELAQGSGGGTVTDVKVNDVSVVDQYGAANIDLTGYAEKTDLGTASALDVASSGDASTSQVVKGDDTRLTNARPASDVSSWAKASTKPEYTASEVGAIATTAKGTANGVAELDENGKVLSAQLPSYVDDVLEYSSISAFPATGESGKIYVALDTNKTYRWSGTGYTEISESLALGETSSTAYRGDRGKTAYDHSQITSGNPHNVTKSDVGLGNVNNTSDKNKPLSDATKEALLMKLGVEALTNYYETSMIVEKPYEAGKIVYVEQEGRLYRTTTSINIGDTLVPDTNCVHVDIEYLLLEKLGVDNLTTVVELVDRASSAHSMYSRFYIAYLNKWAKATANIAINDMLVMGTNYEIVTIEDVFGSIESVLSQMSTSISNKVNKETGKGLSTNDYTTTDKNKVSKIDTSTTSISGNPISISGLKANQLAVNPIITLEPIQDLHGQSKPYPAGGGKNLYNATVQKILGNVNISGEKITASWTTVQLFLSSENVQTFPAGTYTMSAYGSGIGDVAAFAYSPSSQLIGFLDSPRTFTTTSSFFIGLGGRSSISGTASFTILLESGTTTPTAWSPYENICPISGYDKVEILSCGKNLFDKDSITANSWLSTTTGLVESANASYCVSDYIMVKANQPVVIPATQTSRRWFYDKYKNPKTYLNNDGLQVFTPTEDGYIRVTINLQYISLDTFQIEFGNQVTTYVPYNKATSISESLGETVYGGTLDVRTGKLTVTHGIKDMGDLGWYMSSGTHYFSTSISDKMDGSTGLYCSSYEYSENAGYSTPNNGISDSRSSSYLKTIFVRDDSQSSAADFTTAVTGQKVVYRLATPFTIQLTPHEISLLKDYAYLSTNGTNITLDYHNGELASLADVSQLGETVNELGDGCILGNSKYIGYLTPSAYLTWEEINIDIEEVKKYKFIVFGVSPNSGRFIQVSTIPVSLLLNMPNISFDTAYSSSIEARIKYTSNKLYMYLTESGWNLQLALMR